MIEDALKAVDLWNELLEYADIHSIWSKKEITADEIAKKKVEFIVQCRQQAKLKRTEVSFIDDDLTNIFEANVQEACVTQQSEKDGMSEQTLDFIEANVPQRL